ncbi:MAG: hypothetical protein CVU43_01715 [Chloroflexi bacterium HGW-Chloroflexi-5]|nr:MAG: hypothetical protein CVU43_01715 [Chloroflexi bacterium HGW-Chloroflexi-5]
MLVYKIWLLLGGYMLDDLDILNTLIRTIYKLMKSSENDWVSWESVSKEIDGHNGKSELYSALADIEDYRFYFVKHKEKNVILSEIGIRYVQSLPIQQQSEMQIIKQAIISYSRSLNPISIKINSILKVTKVEKKYVYAISCELSDETIPTETPVEIISDDRSSRVQGRIVGQDTINSIIFVSLDCHIFEDILPAHLKLDRGFLLSKLAEKFDRIELFPNHIESLFLNPTDNNKKLVIYSTDSKIVADQLNALPIPWSRVLWGPPGAGKTFALGRLVIDQLTTNKDSRILIVAPSNRAADNALIQILNQIKESDDDFLNSLFRDRKILRFGYPRKKEILENSELLGPEELDVLNQKVRDTAESISIAERENKTDDEISIIRAKLLAFQEEVKNAVNIHINESQVIVTSVTLAYVTETIATFQNWDLVIVDEVTMVPASMCTFLASLSKYRLLLAGDPRQLGPVFERSKYTTETMFEWMGRDIFDKTGISRGQGVERKIDTTDSRLAIISSQRRCSSGIWNKVQHLYQGITNLVDQSKYRSIIQLPPKPEEIVLMDYSNPDKNIESDTFSGCKNYSKSWQNLYTADLAIEVALSIAAEAKEKISIAIISPYRAQVKLLRQRIRTELQAKSTPYDNYNIESGTVHQFQGSDADIVIFDLVDGYGRNQLGKLLKNDEGLRLVNVALTRAKAKFILIADKVWCAKAIIREDNPILWDLIFRLNDSEQIPVSPPKNQNVLVESPIEDKLLKSMMSIPQLKGVVCQHTIFNKSSIVSRADFAFPELKYAIYCDGKQWHLVQNQWQRDHRQRNKLIELGWVFSVFSGNDINNNVENCASQVLNTYRSLLRK